MGRGGADLTRADPQKLLLHLVVFIYYLFYLNIFIQDIKHNSARLLYVVMLYSSIPAW